MRETMQPVAYRYVVGTSLPNVPFLVFSPGHTDLDHRGRGTGISALLMSYLPLLKLAFADLGEVLRAESCSSTQGSPVCHSIFRTSQISYIGG